MNLVFISQEAAFFIVIAVKNSNRTLRIKLAKNYSVLLRMWLLFMDGITALLEALAAFPVS
jgi:hypothetical protein